MLRVIIWQSSPEHSMLRVCQISCAGTELPRLPELRHLNLLHCSALTDAGLAAVAAQFPLLTGLQLKSGSLSDAGLTAIATLTSLERLDLVDCEALKGEGLRAILASLPYLQVGPPFPKRACTLHSYEQLWLWPFGRRFGPGRCQPG